MKCPLKLAYIKNLEKSCLEELIEWGISHLVDINNSNGQNKELKVAVLFLHLDLF